MSTGETKSPIAVEPPPAGFDRTGMRELVKDAQLASGLHKIVRAPFGHTVLSLQTLDAVVDAADLALQTGEVMHAALMEDIAKSGSFAIPDPTRDQRLFI